jgi:hypothetical protein
MVDPDDDEWHEWPENGRIFPAIVLYVAGQEQAFAQRRSHRIVYLWQLYCTYIPRFDS